MNRKYTKKSIIEIFSEYKEEHGHYPTSLECEKNPDLPGVTTIKRHFKMSFGKFMNEHFNGDIHKFNFNKYTREQVIEIFKKEYERIQPKSLNEYKKKRNKQTPSIVPILKYLGMTWNELKKECGYETIETKEFTKEEILDILVDLSEQLSKTPSVSDLKKDGRVSLVTVQKYFKSYNEALEHAGLSVNMKRTQVDKTDSELLEMYKTFSSKIGRMATLDDLNESDEIYNAGVFCFRFGGMLELQRLAGYDPVDRNYFTYSKDQIQKMLVNAYMEKDSKLTNDEIRQTKHLPSPDTICKHFKTTSMTEVWQEVIIIGILKKEFDRIGSATVRDFNRERSNGVYGHNTWVKRLEMSWPEIRRIAGHQREKYTNEELIDSLKKLAVNLGRPPVVSELTVDNVGYTLATLIWRFGSFNNALKLAGLKINKNSKVILTDEELLNQYIEFSQKLGRMAGMKDLDDSDEVCSSGLFIQRFGSMYELQKQAGYNPAGMRTKKYTGEAIKISLLKAYLEKGSVLSVKELGKNKSLPSYTTINRFFKGLSIKEIWQEVLNDKDELLSKIGDDDIITFYLLERYLQECKRLGVVSEKMYNQQRSVGAPSSKKLRNYLGMSWPEIRGLAKEHIERRENE